MKTLTHIRALAALLAVAVVAVGLAACGGSSSGGSTIKDAAGNARAAYTSCLKSHGVSLDGGKGGFGSKARKGFKGGKPSGGFPGSGSGAPSGGIAGGSGAPKSASGGFPGGAGFGNSKFAKAMKACESKLPASERGKLGAGGFGGKRPSGRFKPHFSTTVLDAFVVCIRKHGYSAMPDPKKNSTTGAFFPKSVENSAQFKKALPKCESILRQAFQPHGSSTTSTGTSS
jgi:hypothetical protein